MELLFILISGAITYLVVNAFEKKKTKASFRDVAEYLVETGLNVWVLWMFFRSRDLAGESLLIDGHYYLTYNNRSIITMIVCAVLLGMVIALLKNTKPKITFDMERPGIWSTLNPKKKKLIKTIILAFATVCMIFIAVQPTVHAARLKARREKFRDTVISLQKETETELSVLLSAGVSANDIGSLNMNDIEIQRVNTDQRWLTASDDKKVHAVYMIDGNGVLVYLSYKDSDFCATWSGPSNDENFIISHGGWNNGNGSGWSGTGI